MEKVDNTLSNTRTLHDPPISLREHFKWWKPNSYFFRRAGHRWREWRNGLHPSPVYVFILSPPYSGSTLLHHILSACPYVSPTNVIGTREGQRLPIVRSIMFNSHVMWNAQVSLPWKKIRRIWEAYWDKTKPLLLEKSPTNTLHAEDIEIEFEPTRFIILVRHPYALVAGFRKRNPHRSVQEATELMIMLLKHLREHLLQRNKALLVRYEDLVGHKDDIVPRLEKFLPEAGKISTDGIYQVHNPTGKASKLQNFNRDKMQRFTSEELSQIRDSLEEEKELMHYFNYSLCSL